MHPLVSVSVMFACSLTAAFVLFKFVKSTAGIQGENVGFKIRGFQAGGAIGGFLLTYALLHYSFTSLSSQQSEQEGATVDNVRWTITGNAVKTDGGSPALIKVMPVPPMGAMTNNAGDFRMENITPLSKGKYPDLVFECDEYISHTVTITDETAEIDEENHRIKIKEKVTMFPEGDWLD